MTSTDLALADQMAYAQAVVHQPEPGKGGQSLLPAAYRGNPANVLIAMGLGQALDLTPSQSLYEIYVVNGRPSPSANLMAAVVRRAGHRLRIKGDATTCTAILIRADDPDEPFEATWTIEQARAAGLAGKDTWKQYPAAMLRARAIAEVVRMGASEAVLGMEYAREEMQDVEPERTTVVKTAGVDALRAAVAAVQRPNAADSINVQTSGAPTEGYEQQQTNSDDDVHDAEEVADEPETGEQITDAQRRKIFPLFTEAGFDTSAQSAEGKAARLAYIAGVIGHPVESTNDLTRGQASQVIEALISDAASRVAIEEPPADEAQQ